MTTKTRAALLLALMACAVSASAASDRLLLQQDVAAAVTCPGLASSVELSFGNVASSCEATTVCTTCVCSLVTAFTPALRAGNITFDAAAPTSFPLDAAAGIIRACSEQYLVAMIAAGVDLTVLASLTTCSFDNATSVPPCLVTAVAGLAANASATETGNTTIPDTDELLGTNTSVITTGANTAETALANEDAAGVSVTATSRTDTPSAATPSAPTPAVANPAATSSAAAVSSVLSALGAAVLLAITLMA